MNLNFRSLCVVLRSDGSLIKKETASDNILAICFVAHIDYDDNKPKNIVFFRLLNIR